MSRANEEELYSLELFISRLLRKGVMLAGALLLIGWITQIQFTGNPLAEFQNYQASSLAEHLRLIWEQRQVGLMVSYLGLAVLISLPMLRVFLTAFLFLRQGERILAAVATLVLVLLLISFSLGIEI